MPTTVTTPAPEIEADRRGDPRGAAFVLSSHARPDGDAIGSQLAMAYALGPWQARPRRQPRSGAAVADGVSRRAGHRDRAGSRRRLRRRDHHGVRRPGAHRRRGARARASSSTSITIPATRATGRSTGSTRAAAACGEMVFDLDRRAGCAADAGNRDAYLRGDPDRHGLVSLLEHFAADVRHLPRCCSRPASIRCASRAASTTATRMGRLKLSGALLSGMQIDQTGRIAVVYLDHEIARTRRRHLRRHRRADQRAAHGQGDPGRRVLQGHRATTSTA